MKIAIGDKTSIDLKRLVVSRLLLQANSGGGKSWALRRLLEQTHGHIQQIVIDPEDEFYTLREKGDYILVRHDDGDCVPELRSADLLATRLLELGVSAIISLYELHPRDRREFVKRFLNSLVNAPKKLWHRALIVVDEAHEFCPEHGKQQKGDAVADAVIGLMSKGRKRGFCGVLATQRLSKLNKDAAAEAKNKLIGGATIDVDRKRAAEELGFSSKAETLSLRNLEPGEFYGFGPAISRDVIKFKVGAVETTHPEAGAAPAPVAPPKHKVQSVLAQLADLPQEAEQERATIADLQRKIRELTAANKQLAKAAPKTETKVERREIPVLKDSQITRLEKLAEKLIDRVIAGSNKFTAAVDGVDKFAKQFSGDVDRCLDFAMTLKAFLQRVREWPDPESRRPAGGRIITGDKIPPHEQSPLLTGTSTISRPQTAPVARPAPVQQAFTSATLESAGAGAGDRSGVRRIAIAIAQRRNGATRTQLTTLTGLKKSTRNRYLQHLTHDRLAEERGDRFFMTEAGLAWLGTDYERLPEGEALQNYWLNKLPGSQSDILRVVLENPDGISREAISEATGLKKSTRNRYIQHLQAQELVIANGDIIQPAPELLES